MQNRSTYECPDEPQAINHGLAAANAGIGLLRAFGAIGWLDSTNESKLLWQLVDGNGIKIELVDYLDDLEKFVSTSAAVFISICDIRYTGSKSDYYTGANGTEWYFWKYRNVDVVKCPSFKNDRSNRPEDISHARYELKFMSVIRAVGRDYFNNSSKFGVTSIDIRRLVVSVLNRFIISPDAKNVNRFTCDLNGTTDVKSQSCLESRQLPKRIMIASGLLDVAVASFYHLNERCDALNIVDAILPIFLEGNEDYDDQFQYCEFDKYLLPPLLAKYYFYWYERGVNNC